MHHWSVLFLMALKKLRSHKVITPHALYTVKFTLFYSFFTFLLLFFPWKISERISSKIYTLIFMLPLYWGSLYNILYMYICLYVCVHVLMYMCVCICGCMYVCIYIYMHMYSCIYICMCVCIFIVYMYVYMYMYVCICMCLCGYVCMYMCICTFCIYICIFCNNFFFLPFSTASHGLPLFLDTSNWRRNVWCTQPLTYHITHRHRKMQNHMKTEEVTLELTPPLDKSPLSTKPMEIFIPQLYGKFQQNIHLPMQQKDDTQPLQSHINWGRILSSHQRLIFCSHLNQKRQINAGISSRHAC